MTPDCVERLVLQLRAEDLASHDNAWRASWKHLLGVQPQLRSNLLKAGPILSPGPHTEVTQRRVQKWGHIPVFDAGVTPCVEILEPA